MAVMVAGPFAMRQLTPARPHLDGGQFDRIAREAQRYPVRPGAHVLQSKSAEIVEGGGTR